MQGDTHPRMKIRVRGRSFLAFVLAPEPPLDGWLAELDTQLARSPGFFEARPVIIDMAAITAAEPGADTLLDDLEKRGMSVIDVEHAAAVPGADPWRRPLVGGRNAGEIEVGDSACALPGDSPSEAPGEAPLESQLGSPLDIPLETSLVVAEPVRSGQSVLFIKGDVTVIGSVASGAEVLAGGSIHIYGALRGRAIAGAVGRSNARIFCRRFEAELVSIDGFYMTADDMDPALRGRAVQIRLVGDAIIVSPLG
jgi:septum site-determining protein MinC